MINLCQTARLTRRHLLRGTAATAATALIAACGGNSGATDTPKPLPATTTPTPVQVAATTLPSSSISSATATAPPPPTSAPTALPTVPATLTPTPAATASVAVATVGTTLATTTGSPTAPLIVFVGSSTTIGFGIPPTDNYPAQTIALLAPAKYDAVNLGVNGRPASTMISLAAKNIDPLYAASRSKNVVVMWGGGNDLDQGASAEEAYANIVTFCQARRSVGFKVVVLTLLPRTGYVREGTDYEANRGVINTSIRKNLASFADALADIGANPIIGAAGAQANLDYYQPDGTHPTRKGYSIVAGIVKDAILTL